MVYIKFYWVYFASIFEFVNVCNAVGVDKNCSVEHRDGSEMFIIGGSLRKKLC